MVSRPGNRAGNRRVRSSVPVVRDPGTLLAASLDERWRTFAREVARARRRASERTVHDLRVAARRLMATIDLVSAVRGDEALRKARRELKKHLKAFGALRDTHVQILEIRTMVRTFPVLRSYLRSLTQTEASLVQKARGHIVRMKLEAIEQTLARARGELAEVLATPAAHSYAMAALLGEAGKSFLRASELRSRVSPGQPASIHRLRVAFKKCRYTVEILRPLLPGVDARLVKAMNAYQTRMGVIQDSVVLSAALGAFAVHNTRVSTAAMGAVQHALVERRRALIQAFLESADELHRFWTAPPLVLGVPARLIPTTRQ
jgi:CHAD domain-containing protein